MLYNMKRVIVIGEAGVNHNGNIELAKELVRVAASAGCDYVKFQTFVAKNVVTTNASKAEYQILNSPSEGTQIEMLEKLELSQAEHYDLIDECKKYDIKFLSTAFDMDSIDFLHTLKMGLWKIPSGEITNLIYLQKIGSYNEEVILSTGMSTLGEIENALEILINAGTLRDKITILHCNTEYPTPMSDVNLKAMLTIKNAFGINIGYSDHTLGIEVPIAAVAMGAIVIEKHFTIDRSLPGPDHLASLEPKELTEMVQGIRNVESALGTGIKLPSKSERKNINIARKSIHLVKDVKAGHVLSLDDLIAKRPGNGLSPLFTKEIVGSIVKNDLSKDAMLNLKDLEWK
jgi:N,N'-diacetyllegionaminate synthase